LPFAASSNSSSLDREFIAQSLPLSRMLNVLNEGGSPHVLAFLTHKALREGWSPAWTRERLRSNIFIVGERQAVQRLPETVEVPPGFVRNFRIRLADSQADLDCWDSIQRDINEFVLRRDWAIASLWCDPSTEWAELPDVLKIDRIVRLLDLRRRPTEDAVCRIKNRLEPRRLRTWRGGAI